MKRLIEALFRLPIIFPVPAGMVPDSFALNGLMGLMQNINNYSEQLSSTPTSGTSITLIASSAQVAGNILAGFVQLNPGASGAFNVNLPSTNAIISALGNTVPLDGSYSEPVHISNFSGQTATVVAGDAQTTLLGSGVIVTGNVRKMMLRVLNSSTITLSNVGTWTL